MAFDKLWDKHTPLRQMGIYLSKIDQHCLRQVALFTEDNYPKLSQVDKTIDQIRAKFGSKAIIRACFAKEGVQPMSGGPLSSPYREPL